MEFHHLGRLLLSMRAKEGGRERERERDLYKKVANLSLALCVVNFSGVVVSECKISS